MTALDPLALPVFADLDEAKAFVKPGEDGRIPYCEAWLDVSPKDAKRMLTALHPNQRRDRALRVEGYSTDMKHGDWKLSPIPVIFDWDGYLIDGMHRLMAVVEARVTVRFKVVWGCDPGLMKVIDVNAARTITDALRVSGLVDDVNAGTISTAAAIARRALHWEVGRKVANTMKGVGSITHEVIIATIRNQKDIIPAANVGLDAQTEQRPSIVNAGVYGFFFLMANRVDSEEAQRYHSQFMTAHELPGSSPILAVRTRLLQAKAAVNSRYADERRAKALGRDEALALLVRSWGYFLAGTPIKDPRYLQISRGKLTNETFPRFIYPSEAQQFYGDTGSERER